MNSAIEHANPYKKFTKDTLLAGIASLASALRGLILLPILSKSLGAEAYGIWAQIQVTISLLMMLAFLQLDVALTRSLAAETDKKSISTGWFSLLGAVSTASVLFSILMFILAEPLAMAVFGSVDAEPFIKLAAFLVFLTTIDQAVISYFISFRQMGRYSSFIIAQVAGEIALVAYLVFSGFGLYGAIAALLATRFLLFIIGFLLIRRKIEFAAPSLSILKSYLTFSLPSIPAAFCYWVITLSDRYVIGYFLGAAAVGLYSAPYVLGSVIVFFFAPLSIVLLPAITNLYENNRMQELKTHLKYSLKFYLTLAIPSVFGLSILSKSLLTTLATSEFAEAYLIVALVVIATLLFNCSSIGMNVLLLLKRTKAVGLIYSISAAINIIGNIILVPRIGIIGAAISTLVTFAIHLSLVWGISFKEISFDIDLKFIAKSLISSAAMGFLIWKLSPVGAVSIIIAIAAGAAVYFAFLMLVKGFSKEEYRFFKDMIKAISPD